MITAKCLATVFMVVTCISNVYAVILDDPALSDLDMNLSKSSVLVTGTCELVKPANPAGAKSTEKWAEEQIKEFRKSGQSAAELERNITQIREAVKEVSDGTRKQYDITCLQAPDGYLWTKKSPVKDSHLITYSVFTPDYSDYGVVDTSEESGLIVNRRDHIPIELWEELPLLLQISRVSTFFKSVEVDTSGTQSVIRLYDNSVPRQESFPHANSIRYVYDRAISKKFPVQISFLDRSKKPMGWQYSITTKDAQETLFPDSFKISIIGANGEEAATVTGVITDKARLPSVTSIREAQSWKANAAIHDTRYNEEEPSE